MGRRRRVTNFDESMAMNAKTYGIYYERLAELAMTMFKWDNLPATVDQRFLELTLFYDGSAVFFKDDVIGYLGLQCILNGDFTVYRIPKNRRAFAVNGYQKILNEKDSVLIYNNYLHTNCIGAVKYYSRKLYELDRIITINANAQKSSVLITGTNEQKLTLVNLYKQWDGMEPVIFGDNSLNPESLRVLKTDTPYMADKLYALKTKIWNEALTYLGITNVDTSKKERMITDEIVQGQGDTYASRNSRLKAREEAVQQINDMFGLNVRVEYDDSAVRDMLAIFGVTESMSLSGNAGKKEGESNE